MGLFGDLDETSKLSLRTDAFDSKKVEPRPWTENAALLNSFEYFTTEYGHGILADCFEAMKGIPSNSVDMILCDLPYGTTDNAWDTILPFDKLWEVWKRICKPTTAVVLTAAQPFTSKVVMSNLADFKCNWFWKKNIVTNPFHAQRMPMRNIEDVLVFYKKQCTYNPQGVRDYAVVKEQKSTTRSSNYGGQGGGAYEPCPKGSPQKATGFPTCFLEFDSVNSFAEERETHPTEKPVLLFDYLMRTYTNEGDFVLDCCSGAMTTGVAAEHSKRKWLCIEKERKYFLNARSRFNWA